MGIDQRKDSSKMGGPLNIERPSNVTRAIGITRMVTICHRHLRMISLQLARPKLRLNRSQPTGMKAVAISLNRSQLATSAGRNSLKLKPLSTDSAAKTIIPNANIW